MKFIRPILYLLLTFAINTSCFGQTLSINETVDYINSKSLGGKATDTLYLLDKYGSAKIESFLNGEHIKYIYFDLSKVSIFKDSSYAVLHFSCDSSCTIFEDFSMDILDFYPVQTTIGCGFNCEQLLNAYIYLQGKLETDPFISSDKNRQD